MPNNETKITPSIVDRLIDLEPKYSTEAEKSRSQSLEELKSSVRRDIEWLLNTRHSVDKVPEGLVEVRKSLATYGIPDFTGQSSKDAESRKTLLKSVETALRTFEPRLINLKVELAETDIVNRGVRFKIRGAIRLDPTPEPVVFDTVLSTGSGDFSVKEE